MTAKKKSTASTSKYIVLKVYRSAQNGRTLHKEEVVELVPDRSIDNAVRLGFLKPVEGKSSGRYVPARNDDEDEKEADNES